MKQSWQQPQHNHFLMMMMTRLSSGDLAAQACVCLSRQTKMRETVAMFAIIAHQHVLVENLFLQCASVFQLKSRGGGLYYDEIQCPASSFRYLESCFSFHACWMSGRRCAVLLAPLVLKLERSFLTFPFIIWCYCPISLSSFLALSSSPSLVLFTLKPS